MTAQAPAALTTRRRDRDVGQCRVLLGPVPVFLTGLDMHHVSHRDFSFFLLVRNDTGAGRDHQNLVAGVGMPPGRGPSTEIDDTTAVVVRRVVGDDCLPCPCYRASRPSGNRSSLAQRFFRQGIESDDAHDFTPPGRPRVTSSSPRGRLPLVNLTRAPRTDAMPWLRARRRGRAAGCE